MKNESGQSLFEIILALAITTLIIVALVALTATSIRNTTFSKNKTLASRFSQEATEWLRGERDSNFAAFRAHVEDSTENTRCLNNLVWTINPCGTVTMDGTPFKREVVFRFSDSDTVIKAEITVSWTDSGGLHEVKSSTNFSDWQ